MRKGYNGEKEAMGNKMRQARDGWCGGGTGERLGSRGNQRRALGDMPPLLHLTPPTTTRTRTRPLSFSAAATLIVAWLCGA
jgi:hypothetical protein